MKNINTKKVVAGVIALGTAALFAGAVVAANVNDGTFTSVDQLTKDQLFTDGIPSVNVAVGSMAQPVDIVWAGNIAAAIGKKAYISGDAVGGYIFNNATVTVGSESTSAVTGDGKLFDDDTLHGTYTPAYTLKDTDFTKLFDADIDYDDSNNNSETLNNVNDELSVELNDVYFEDNYDVQALLLKIAGSKISYTLNLDDGIEAGLTTSDDHDLTIPFMGKMYDVRSTASDGSDIELVMEENTISYNEGVQFEVAGIGTYAGETLTVEIGTISSGSSENSVQLKLLDTTGTQISSKTVDDGDDVDFDDKISEFTVTGVYYTENSTSYVEISTGTDTFKLEDGEEVDDFTVGEREWTVDFTNGTNDVITAITLTNDDGWDEIPVDADVDFPALKVGEKAMLPIDFGYVEFLGLKDEDMSILETNNKEIKWIDAEDDDHTLPLWTEKSDSSDLKVKIDGKDYYFDWISDSNVMVKEGTNDEGDSVSIYVYTDDNNPTNDSYVLDATGTMIADTYFYILSDVDSTPLYFYLDVNNTNGKYGLAVAAKLADEDANATNGGAVVKTDAYELGSGKDWYLNGSANDSGFADYYYINGFADKETEITEFVLADINNDTVKFYLDSETQKIAQSDDYDSTIPESDIVDADHFSLDNEDSEDIEFGITDFGTEVSIESGEVVISQPDTQRVVEVFFGSGSTTSTNLIGDTYVFTEADIGVTKEGDEGTKASLDSIDILAGASGDAIVPSAWNVSTDRLVWLDTEAPSTPLIIVGGYLVNTLAETTYGLEDLVVASGDYIAGQAANGNIIVAGMDAADTAEAAKELITAIEGM